MQQRNNRQQLIAVRIGFMRLGTSMHAFCNENGIDDSNAAKALIGKWKGEKATALKKHLFEAAGIQSHNAIDE